MPSCRHLEQTFVERLGLRDRRKTILYELKDFEKYGYGISE